MVIIEFVAAVRTAEPPVLTFSKLTESDADAAGGEYARAGQPAHVLMNNGYEQGTNHNRTNIISCLISNTLLVTIVLTTTLYSIQGGSEFRAVRKARLGLLLFWGSKSNINHFRA